MRVPLLLVLLGAGTALPAVGQEPGRPALPAALRPVAALELHRESAAARPESVAAPAGRASAPPPGVLRSEGGAGVERVLASPAGAFTASLVVPGAGQAALGLRRWPLYVVAEAALWWVRLEARGDFAAYRGAYRDLAWEAARLREGPRRDGGWSYYETMSHFLESGAYDRDAAAGLQPELDPQTYNGSVWELARAIYFPGGDAEAGSTEYALALEWYAARAAGPGFLWSWVGREAELERFRGLIGSADGAARAARRAAGAILANHLVSAVDALVVARLRAGPGPELHSRVLVERGPPAWELELRIPLTN